MEPITPLPVLGKLVQVVPEEWIDCTRIVRVSTRGLYGHREDETRLGTMVNLPRYIDIWTASRHLRVWSWQYSGDLATLANQVVRTAAHVNQTALPDP